MLVHLGGGCWAVVDSCTDTSDRQDRLPVAERYLRSLGVDPAQAVKLIVATHWHDDHVRGMARLVEVCPTAVFSCSAALLREEFIAYVRQLSTGATATDGAKVREINRVFDLLRTGERPPIRRALGSRTLLRVEGAQLSHNEDARIVSLSPSDREYEVFLQHIAQLMPMPHRPMVAAPPRQSPNLASVVLSVSIGDVDISLAADMELHSERLRGWNAVLSEATTIGVGKASLVKVAHHGSRNGHHGEFWREFVGPQPVCVVTPFNRLPASSKLPTETDIARLTALGQVYVAGPRNLPRPRSRAQAVERSLRECDIEIRDLRSALGMVRLRRGVGDEGGWRAQLFPPAHEARASTVSA